MSDAFAFLEDGEQSLESCCTRPNVREVVVMSAIACIAL